MVAAGHPVEEQGRCERFGNRAMSLPEGALRFLLLLALLCVVPRAGAADAVEIAAVVGFADTFQPGRWTPLSVTVANRGGDVSGELEVQVTGGDELRGRPFVTSHRRMLELQHGSRKNLQFTILPEGLSRPLVIRVRADGRELARTEIDLRPRFAPERLILALSRDANLDYLNGGGADGLRVIYPHLELLPAHWRGYDAVAAVIVHGVSLERLSASQFDALHKWVAQGGILAVSGGPDYALLRTPRLAELLPGPPLGMTRVDALELRRAFSFSLGVSRPVHVNRLGSFRGRARLRSGETPLIVERSLGLGRVVYLTFNVAGYPFDRWDGMRKLWLDSLRLPPPASTHLRPAEAGVESPLPPLIRAESTKFPSHATVVFFLALYLGLLLAGNRLPARSRAASLLGWAAPVLFAPAAWLLFGPVAYPRGATAVTIAVIEPFPGSAYARLGLHLGVYASRSGALRLEYRGAEPVLYPPRQARRDGNAADWVFGEGSRYYAEPLDRRRYVLHALEGEDVIAFHIEASVHDEPPGPRLVLDNASGRALDDLRLVFEGYAYEIGSLAAGTRLERRLMRHTHGVEAGEPSWQRALGPAAQAPSAGRIAIDRRARETGENGYPGPGHALLIGYAASPLQPSGASAGWPRRERALVAIRVAAIPGNAAAGATGAETLERGAGDLERRGSRWGHGRSPDAAATQ